MIKSIAVDGVFRHGIFGLGAGKRRLVGGDSKPFRTTSKTVLAPTSVVTREDIERWQATSVVEIMSRLPGVDIAQSGGMGSTSSTFIRGTESRHVLVLIDGIPLNNAGSATFPI